MTSEPLIRMSLDTGDGPDLFYTIAEWDAAMRDCETARLCGALDAGHALALQLLIRTRGRRDEIEFIRSRGGFA